MMHNFICDELGLTISFTAKAVSTMCRYRQNENQVESGGVLFCEDLFQDKVIISHASKPRLFDIRKKFFFKLNGWSAQRTIKKMFSNGLHYVGEWHTHAQISPTPSNRDIKTIQDIFEQSEHNLRYMLMVIVSSSEDFSKSFVAFADSRQIYRCVSA